MVLHIKVKPNSKKNVFLVSPENAIVVKIKAPAQDGKANIAICEYLGEIFEIAKSKVEILTGFTSSFKKVTVEIGEEEGNRILEIYKSGT